MPHRVVKLTSGLGIFGSKVPRVAFILAATASVLVAMSMSLSAQGPPAAGTSEPATVSYSVWDGDCMPGQHGGLTCTMHREARAANGAHLGVIAYGEADRSRFLYVEVEQIALGQPRSLHLAVDGIAISGGLLVCRQDWPRCDIVVTVNDSLLGRLERGNMLVLQEPEGGGVAFQFPLGDFGRARHRIL